MATNINGYTTDTSAQDTEANVYKGANKVGSGLESSGIPWLQALGLITQGSSAIVQGSRAAKQKALANHISAIRPILQQTSASSEFENRARTMANSTRLPNQGYYENLLGQQTAQTANKELQTSNSSAEALAGLTQADRNQREGINQLAGQGADYRLQSEQNLNNALAMKQGEELNMFDYNKNQPYQTALLRKQSLIDASNRNLQGSLDTLSQGFNDASTLNGYQQFLGNNNQQVPNMQTGSLGGNTEEVNSGFGGNLLKKAGVKSGTRSI